jgi:hypothetical protein
VGGRREENGKTEEERTGTAGAAGAPEVVGAVETEGEAAVARASPVEMGGGADADAAAAAPNVNGAAPPPHGNLLIQLLVIY